MNQIGLVFKCPIDKVGKEDCPFKSIRSITNISDRVFEWKKLNIEIKLKMIKHHLNCTNIVH